MSEENRCQRLRFRSWHRGTREMDLLLGSFADAGLATFSKSDLDNYEKLLERADPDIFNWITGQEKVPEEYNTEIMRRLQNHRFAELGVTASR